MSRIYLRLLLAGSLLALPAGVWPAAVAGQEAGPRSDFAAEVAHLERELIHAEPSRRLYLAYTRAVLTADPDDLERAWRLAEEAVADSAADEPLLYRATLALELHRLEEAEAALDRLRGAAAGAYARQLRTDIALARGRHAEARRDYEAQLADRRSWDRLARVAYLERACGRPRRADRLYAEAQASLTVKEMRRYAWLELQRGLIDLDRERHEEALRHFRRAERAYSGHWLIEEHLAEALAALGRVQEAEALYRRVVEAVEQPEYAAALAALVAARDPAEARALDRRASWLFEERFARFPEAVAGPWADYLLAHDPRHPRLLALAEFDHRLRPGAEATLRLARVHLALGETDRARQLAAGLEAAPCRPPGLAELRRRLRAASP